MKAAAIAAQYAPRRKVSRSRFPNAADHRLTAEKVLDVLLAAGIALGVVSMLLFALTL